ncbi:hypothetical protein AB2B41_07625 [Marimonas sp. MJW-29]|uniref:Uncharacterized protein n=1 Tax=Sulfitobacter sediminis TaxID=3234186 RepID=A0ABV3RKQ7_9RHOB
MQDRTIDSALLALRKQIIRNKGEGLEHVEELLRMRGVHMPRVLPPKRKDVAPRGMMTAMLLEALRDGPMTLREATAYVAKRRPELEPDFAYGRTLRVLVKLKAKGLVQREGRLWLAP